MKHTQYRDEERDKTMSSVEEQKSSNMRLEWLNTPTRFCSVSVRTSNMSLLLLRSTSRGKAAQASVTLQHFTKQATHSLHHEVSLASSSSSSSSVLLSSPAVWVFKILHQQRQLLTRHELLCQRRKHQRASLRLSRRSLGQNHHQSALLANAADHHES